MMTKAKKKKKNKTKKKQGLITPPMYNQKNDKEVANLVVTVHKLSHSYDREMPQSHTVGSVVAQW